MLTLGRTRPELILVPAALLVPSGFVSVLRVPLGQHGYLTMLQILGILAFALALIRHKFREQWRCNAGIPISIAFVVAGTLAAAGSDAPIKAAYWIGATGVLLLGLSLILGGRLREDPRSVHVTVAVVGTILASVAIIEWYAHQSILEPLYVKYDLTYLPGSTPGFRPPSLTGNALTTASSLAVVYSIVLVSPYIRRGRVPMLIILAAGALVTLSRSAILLISVATLIFLLASRVHRDRASRRLKRQVAVFGIPLLVAAVAYIGPQVTARLGEQVGLLETGRADTGKRALDMIWASPSPTGLGLGGYKRTVTSTGIADDTSTPATIDDQWLTYLLELGWFGSMILLVGLAIGAKRAIDGHGLWLPALAVVGIGLFLESLEHDSTMLVSALGIALLTTPKTPPRPEEQRL